MTIAEAFVLGIVQGVTEFLPISSSGHLVLARKFMDIGTVPLLFDVLLHVATLAVIMFYYRVKIGELSASGWRFLLRRSEKHDAPQLQRIAMIIGATVITVALALVLRKTVLASDSTRMVSILLLVTAMMLVSTRFIPTSRSASPRIQTIVTGIAQGFGTLAGISRSGSTISAALWTGMKREEAGEYSFILSIPAVLGALVLTLGDFSTHSVQVALLPTIAGCVGAFLAGMASLRLLLWMVRTAKLWYFSFYLIIIGLLGLLLAV